MVRGAQTALYEAHALIALRAAERTCRVTHEQACMMHPRVDRLEEGTPSYVTTFRAALAEAEGKVPASVLQDMQRQTDAWEHEAALIFRLRECVAQKDIAGLAEAIERAQKDSTNINVEPPKRQLEKLNKLVERQHLQDSLAQALADEHHDCARLSGVIDEAKAAGVPTYDATATLVAWQKEARELLAAARTSRSKDQLQAALERVRTRKKKKIK